MKVFLHAPKESWVVDRFCDEFYADNRDVVTLDPRLADVIWLVADWCWDQLPYTLLQKKTVLTSVHHIVPEKFGADELKSFVDRDKITNAYHVPCELTKIQVENLLKQIGSEKPIFVRPFWVNESLWRQTEKFAARKALGLNENAFFISSFQRDTEGRDLVSPKLEKGPDVFCDLIEKMHKEEMNPHVLLGGWRRQYIINRLEAMQIPFVYNELPNFDVLRLMYSATDLYLVTARYEGGPQSIFECAAMDVPIVSTNVGAATEILHPNSIFNPNDFDAFLDAKMSARSDESREYAYQSVKKHFRNPSFQWFRNLLNQL